ncbi:MAG TPA: nitroreductase family protein [Acidimicrobiia bacterium]|jgi:nitroreductase
METWDAITSRRNVRRFTAEPVPAESLERILEAGRRSPSSRNEQRWDFVAVTDRDQLRRLSGVWRGAGWIADAPAAVAVVAPIAGDRHEHGSIQYDLGQTTTFMMLAAADLGLGAGHAAVEDQELARQVLGLPDDRELAWIIGLGHPADGPLRPIRRPDRRPIDDVVHRDRW